MDLKSVVRGDNKRALHEQVSDLFRAAIHAGVYQPGERIEAERGLMEQGSLSYPTVSKALRKLADEGLLVRKVGAGTYVNTNLPDRCSIRKLGIYYYDTQSPLFRSIYRGVENQCARLGIKVVPISIGFSAEGEDSAIRVLEEKHGVDGILAMPWATAESHDELMQCIRNGMPVVVMGPFLIDQVECSQVGVNNSYGAYLLTEHLLDCGHRRIGFVGGMGKFPYGTCHLSILSGINEAQHDAGIGPNPDLQALLPLTFDEMEDEECKEAVLGLARKSGATAIVCATDGLARYVINVLNDAGLRVPEDVSVGGFGDFAFAADMSPALTTVSWPLERLGREAVKMIVTRSMFPGRPLEYLMLDVRLILRRSTASVPGLLRA